MFDVGWSELLVIGVVALIVVGPKELPALLRTVGRYLGIVKRQAAEFRQQFDEAIRESEIANIKKDVENIGQEFQGSLAEVEASVKGEIDGVRKELDETAGVIAREDRPAGAGEAAGDPSRDPWDEAYGKPTGPAPMTDDAGAAEAGASPPSRPATGAAASPEATRTSNGALPT